MSFHADSDLFSDVCYCDAWTIKLGSNSEKHAIAAIDIFAIIVSVLPLMYYMYSSWKSTCGWEEVYVCSIELTKCFISLFRSYEAPGVLYLSTGNTLYWLRYGEWLLTCPVILIHLSNITGLKDAYSKRTMKLLVSDIGTIVFGVSSAASTGPLKIFFFVLGLIYGANTFFHAAKVYVESYHMVPRGTCKLLVRLMAMVYFVSWSMFPIFFVLGPEGFGVLSHLGSDIAHTWIDLMSKNLWGFIGHLLRQKIHYHILKHGDIRKTTKVNIAGEEVNVETYVEEEDEETVKHSTKELANRSSFLLMRDRMQAKGIEVRASLDESASLLQGKGNSGIEPGRVILAVPDMSMVEFFSQQVRSLPIDYELVPALGMETALQLVQQAHDYGGCDFILAHPNFLTDRSPSGFVQRLRMMGQRVCAFGWSPSGPMKDLIEGAGLDGWLEGPSFGSGINQAQLMQLISQMQSLRKSAMMGGMGMMNMGMMGGPMAPAGMMMNGGMPAGMMMSNPMVMANGAPASLMGMTGMMPPGSSAMMANPHNGMMMAGGGDMISPRQGHTSVGNPLFGVPSTPPSPPASQAPQQVDEAAMLQQLMGEITRLKNELGE